jgi:hypothetical protein
MKSYVAFFFFFTSKHFVGKKKFNSIPAHISKYLLRPLSSHLIYYLNISLPISAFYLFYPPGEESSFHSIFFFLVENISDYLRRRKQTKTETIFPIF